MKLELEKDQEMSAKAHILFQVSSLIPHPFLCRLTPQPSLLVKLKDLFAMRFLFIGPGYPGAKDASHGSGIGTYLREITLGLMARGHECHVIAWGGQGTGGSEQDAKIQQLNNLTTQQLSFQEVGGSKVYLLPHSYWPVIERFMPDSRDVWNMRQLARKLDAEFHYDWIEIQSEEGIGIGVQRAFPEKTILRAHTTLLQMVEYKGEQRAGGSGQGAVRFLKKWETGYRLWREWRSFAIAKRIVTHSKAHAEEIKKLYPGIVEPAVVNHGIGEARSEKLLSCQVAKLSSEAPEASVITALSNSTAKQLNNYPVPPTFLVIGSPDRRKGFDRIRPVLEAYAAKYGPCRCVIVGGKKVDSYWLMVNGGGRASRIVVEWESGLSEEELANEYDNATVYLHLARYESFGVPLIEAAAHGVPIVSTRVGIALELLEGELEVCLVDGNDPTACARVIDQVIRDREHIRTSLFQRHKMRYTRNVMVQEFIKKLERFP